MPFQLSYVETDQFIDYLSSTWMIAAKDPMREMRGFRNKSWFKVVSLIKVVTDCELR